MKMNKTKAKAIEFKWSSLNDVHLAKKISEVSLCNSYLWERDQDDIAIYLKKSFILLVKSGGVVIGWLIVQPLSSGWIRFNTIYVDSRYRKRGLARRMLMRAMRRYRRKRIVLSVSNYKLLRRVKKLGFRSIGFFSFPFKIIFLIIKEGFKTGTIMGNLKLYFNHKIHNLVFFPKHK